MAKRRRNTPDVRETPTETAEPKDTLGVWLVLTPMIGGLLAWPADAFDRTETASMVVGFGVIGITAILAQLDARRWDYRGAHFAWLLLVWVAFYPLYMWRRSRRHGAPRKFAYAIAAMLVFINKDIITLLRESV